MNEFSVQTRCDMQDDDSSYEDAAASIDNIHSNQFVQNFTENPSLASNTDSGSRQEKTASGFFSFLRWFRKGKDDNDNCEADENGEFIKGLADPTVPSSPQLIRTTSSSCGSIDTLFSTATVNSFAFVAPTSYRPFGTASQPEKQIAVGPDTDTYRHRLHQRDQIRELDRNLTLRKKYHLFGSGTLVKSGVNTPNPSPVIERKNKDTTDQEIQIHNLTPGSQNSTFGKKKRKAPDPPRAEFSDSLPNSLDKCRSKSKSMDNGDPVAVRKPRHRRTVSDSSKDRKAGAYCHVKGKRRAPQPPLPVSNLEQQGGSTLDRFRSQFGSFGRKKRPAPQPPEESFKKRDNKEHQASHSYQERSKSTVGQLSPEEKERLIANIAKLKAHADKKTKSCIDMDSDSRFSSEQVVCNDSLKLERGVLKQNKELPKLDTVTSESKVVPVSPRPWYKRSLTNKDGLSGLKRDIFKSLEKKKDREKEKHEEWMPEVGIPRVIGNGLSNDGSSCSSTNSRFNIFARLERSDDKKKEVEKRKSQVSMLANISELDREAAEIVQKEQAREQALLAAHDAKFYSYPDVPVMDGLSDEVEVPKRSSARELISLFNAIGNVTKVTVNSTFFSKEGSSFFSREGIEKRFSFMGESVRTNEQRVVIGEKTFQQQQENQSFVIQSNSSSRIFPDEDKCRNLADSTRMTVTSDLASDITIEEIKDDLDKSSRSRVMYEANKSHRHHSPSPSIPTIAEQSESASSVATTPASTLDAHPGSNNHGSDNIPVTNTSDDLQHAKQVTVWSCTRCTLENPRWKITCDACGRWRPSVPDEKPDVSKCDEPFQRPTSPLHDTKIPANKVQLIKMELSKKGKGINWEEELKRYLPNNELKAVRNNKHVSKQPIEDKDHLGTENIARVSVDGVQINSSTINQNGAVLENYTGKTKCEELLTSKNKTITSPSLFSGDLKQGKENFNKDAEVISCTVTVNGAGPVIERPDVDEVRKARLAFFNRTTETNDDLIFSDENSVLTTVPNIEQKVCDEVSSELVTMKNQVDGNEQFKLREMLKEMKNSLPKRPVRSTNSIGMSKNLDVGNSLTSSEHDNIESKLVNDAHKLGAIKKDPQKISKYESKIINNTSGTRFKQEGKLKLPNGIKEENSKAEAILITSKTVYEDIKVKKAVKPMKVSTSVQTSSIMEKAEAEKGERSKNSDLVPVTVEEFSTTGIKDGVLYTSLNKESRRIGKGTFELIHARDFANIEATKICGESSAVHVYANVPPSSLPEQNSHFVSGCVTQPVFPSQQPVPALVQQCSGNKRNVSETEEITQNEKKNNQENQGVALFDATSSVISANSDSNQGGPIHMNQAASEMSNFSVTSVSSSDCSEVERLTAQLTLPKGIADFKADLQAALPQQNMNTLAINRLLRRLEAAIAGGQHNQAAVLAKDLARLKINCSVTRQRRSLDAGPASILVDMYVEDKVSHQGPISLQVIPTMTVAQLKEKVEEEFEIPVGVQRWILGKLLASDDTKMLQDHNVNSNGCPMFLYLVAPDGEQEGDAIGTAGSIEKHNACEVVAKVPGPPPLPEQPGGWYYNNEEDRYSFCEDTESEMTDDEESEFKKENPVKEANKPDKIVLEDSRKETEEEEEEDYDDDGGGGGDGIVGAAAVVIHEKPVVLQAPVIGRPFMTQAPYFLKTVVGQHPNKPSSSQTSQLQRPQKNSNPCKNQVYQSLEVTPTEKEIADQKSGTLRLGWKCPVCTLVNSPTRPGCAACTTERPLRYIVPVEYRANKQELQRMKQEQKVDNELQQITAEERQRDAEKQHQHYLQLVDLDNTDLVPNVEPFECSVCIVQYEAGEGVVLRECLHVFCRTCLANTVQFNEEAEVKCPYRDADYACNSVLQEREIKALVPADIYEQHLAKSVAQAENKIGNAFHCKTPDCRGWCIFEDNVNEFKCPVCRRINCLTCQAIHDGVNCKQYQEQVKQESETNAEARRTKEMLEEMVERGEAMNCPTCQVVLMKKWGCDWLRCSMCKTEICWVTRGPRWGPAGKGDTTGGCQCGVNGVKCHPRCNYCH
ncbi:RanBP-type and C3HC4-type zinc finger-containing protein 1 [Zootermopsis nevadensis]|uniref:RanBP-type and C3HC4-type zinc finger-containing protein 1 n=2 Tax=Zootermopsis nevadensis TaxID=136037 RepID=A0A067R798_ZOONE|nr:RanBP-type and C3HC4-type zinc finger-containing protein 1 [Zootermopsis nevadensis]